ncbi:hypothetical protein [Thalassolituus marinus]|uniref:Transcriptional regulator SutA RNAP-binding domain-containing protein n=1 Tax=Thalassolituus marinus TaxID=671053 RepID=A0ABS7ZL10_9GAMM|nr:hypothetical protein [Thalassolituus marinus]MCA6062406.1 hypothetical protein [Thalassolituus marinus]
MSDEELEMQDEAIDGEDEMDNDDTEMSADSDSNDSDDEEATAAAADESHSSLAARNRVRESMAAEVEAFLARGGQIQTIDDNVMADPPRKPTSNYGSRPI